MENIHYLEQALKADFANPLYALARIADRQEWAQYRTLFKMHANLKLIELYLTLGSKYDKMVAYFYNAPWKRQNLESLEQAESAYRLALGYWGESLRWAARIPRLRYNLEQSSAGRTSGSASSRATWTTGGSSTVTCGAWRGCAPSSRPWTRTPISRQPRSQDQHRVPVGEEAVALAHRLPVGAQDRPAARRRRKPAPAAWSAACGSWSTAGSPPGSGSRAVMYSEVCPSPARSSPSLQADSSVRTAVVPTARTGRPSARARFTASAVSGGTRVGLRVHDVVLDALAADRQEGAQAHVQGDRRPPRRRARRSSASSSSVRCSPAVGAAAEPVLPGVHGLVPGPVRRGVLPADVRRQRHVAVPFQVVLVHGGIELHTCRIPAGLHHGSRARRRETGRACRDGCGRCSSSAFHLPPSSGSSSSTSIRPPVCGEAPNRRALRTRLSFSTMTVPAGRSEGRSAIRAWRRAPPRPVQHQQARGAPLGRGFLGDQLRLEA